MTRLHIGVPITNFVSTLRVTTRSINDCIFINNMYICVSVATGLLKQWIGVADKV